MQNYNSTSCFVWLRIYSLTLRVQGKNKICECFRTMSWGDYLNLRERKYHEDGEMINFVFVFFTKYYSDDEINEDYMGGTCCIHSGNEKFRIQ